MKLRTETYWIAWAGIDRDLIYGHQTPNMDFYGFADDHHCRERCQRSHAIWLGAEHFGKHRQSHLRVWEEQLWCLRAQSADNGYDQTII
jgi:hypothetical protein